MDLDKLRIDRGPTAAPPARRSLPWFRLGLLALAVAAVWWFRSPLLAKLEAARTPTVAVGTVTRSSALAASADEGVAANGYVVAATRAALSADTPGRIVELNVEEGSVVRRGDVVARLFSDEVRAALDAAEAQLAVARAGVERARVEVGALDVAAEVAATETAAARARLDEAGSATSLAAKELARSTELLANDAIDRASFDRAEAEVARARAARTAAEASVETAVARERRAAAELEAARARVAEAEAQVPVQEALVAQAAATLDKTEVRAPFDGVVVLKDAEVGEVVSPNSQGGNSRGSVCTMIDFDSLEVQVDLPEKNLEAASVGLRANVYLDAYPTRRYRAHVSRIWPTANRQKASVEVRIKFDEPDELLRPEMSVRVVLDPKDAPESVAEGEERVLVPADALVTDQGGRTGVYLLERDVVHFREVRAGERRGRRVVVEEGLEGGERVVLAPASSLEDGARVRVSAEG